MSPDTGVPPTMAQLYPIHSTNVVVEQMQDHAEYKNLLVPELLEEFKNNPNQKAPWAIHCDTWQIPATGKGLEHLNNGLQIAIESYFNYMGCRPFKYEIKAWFNVHTCDMYQEVHDHISSSEVLSGIYYLQFDKEKDLPVFFMNQNKDYINLLKYKEIPTALEETDLNIEEGSLVLFPPTAQHYVPKAKVKHDGLRISLSFNVHLVHVLDKNDTGN